MISLLSYLGTMKEPSIFFFKEGVKFRLSDRQKLQHWIIKMTKKESHDIENLNFIFCTDKYLKQINNSYLNHDYFTDIITFDNSTSNKEITGDIFISIDRVKVNALLYNVSFRDELNRVMAHGVLHLLGYGDKNEKARKEMRVMEDSWLEKRGF